MVTIYQHSIIYEPDIELIILFIPLMWESMEDLINFKKFEFKNSIDFKFVHTVSRKSKFF